MSTGCVNGRASFSFLRDFTVDKPNLYCAAPSVDSRESALNAAGMEGVATGVGPSDVAVVGGGLADGYRKQRHKATGAEGGWEKTRRTN